jgi:TPR repeat protein
MVLTARQLLLTTSACMMACMMACQVAQPHQRAASRPGAEAIAAAYAEYQTPCQDGSAEACVKLGRAGLHYGGLSAGVPWLIEACDLKPQACVALGDALIGRRANASDPRLAALAYRRACEAEHSGACYELAVLHYLGLGVEVDDPLAARLHHAACDGGIPEGCAYLVFLYDRGFGVRSSAVTSAYYREVACDRGYQDMCRRREGNSALVEAAAPAAEAAGPAAEAAAPAVAEPPRTKPARPRRFKPAGAPPPSAD